ncbi:hydrolase TatD family protein [Bacilli bacterium]|nr:hydrolase TatD family protein [Bacilli bacterium]
MKYFDTHCHLCLEKIDANVDKIINDCKEFYLNNIGVDIPTSKLSIEQAKKYTNVFCSIGVHPVECNNISNISVLQNELEMMLKSKNENKIIAIGETGFDFYHKPYNFTNQKQMFLMHTLLAKKYNLPLILHIRNAHQEAIDFIKENCKGIKLLVHCFDGNKEIAQQYLNIGCYLAFGGKITFETNHYLIEALSITPNKYILSETDSPFLTPKKYGKIPNTPIHMVDVVQCINRIKNMCLTDEIFNNALHFFNM